MSIDDGRIQLVRMKEALAGGEVRVELGTSFSLSEGALPTARVFAKNDAGRWAKVDPLLVAPENDQTRAGLLRMLAMVLGSQLMVDLDDPASWHCDFCNDRGHVHWTHVTPNTSATRQEAAARDEIWHEDPNWAACDTCHELIQQNDSRGLARHSFVRQGQGLVMIGFTQDEKKAQLLSMAEQIGAIHAAFWRTYKGEYWMDEGPDNG